MASKGKTQLSRGHYTAHQIGDELLLIATGVHPTPGFKEFFKVKSLSGVPKLAFFCVTPSGIQPDVITPFQHHERFRVKGTVEKIVITDADGDHEVKVIGFAARAAIAAVQPEAEEPPCGDAVRQIVGDWANNSTFTDDQKLSDVFLRGPCNNGAISALARALQDQFGAVPTLSCSTQVDVIVLSLC
jgi:hypothetical protein